MVRAGIVAQGEGFDRGTFRVDRTGREKPVVVDMAASQVAGDQTTIFISSKFRSADFYLIRVVRGSIHRVSLGRHATARRELGITIRNRARRC